MRARDIHGCVSVSSRAHRSLLFWTLIFAAGCGVATQDYGVEDGSDAGADLDFEDLDNKALLSSYEAERRTDSKGCTVADNRAGFSGTGFMDYGESGTWIEWSNVSVEVDGAYTLAFRYANGGTSNRQTSVSVNAASAGNMTFAPTGNWTTWKSTSLLKVMLRAGNNRIRITANTGAGGPNLDNMTVRRLDDGGGSVNDLGFVNFSKLKKDTTTSFNNVTSKYIVFDASHGSTGHDDVDKNDARFVEVTGAKLIGYGGGWDKYLVLFEVTSRAVKLRTHAGSRAVFVNTSKRLALMEARSLDPSMPQGREDVPGPNADNEIIIYAEDEGGKGEGAGARDPRFQPLAHKYFGAGDDDIIYVFSRRPLGDTPPGNGAYMRLKIL